MPWAATRGDSDEPFVAPPVELVKGFGRDN
jgi:hypothetical protein